MKKSIYIILLSLSFIIGGCNTEVKSDKDTNTETSINKKPTQQITPKLFINTITVIGTGKNKQKKDTITEVTDKYFEVRLGETTDTSYAATFEIESPKSIKDFRMKFFNVVNEKGDRLYFETSTSFLNFMDKRNYEMVDSKANKYGFDFTFQRKEK